MIDTIPLALGCVAAFLVAVRLTAALRQYALRNDILDHVNERSSHSAPTPRGGGLSVVIVSLGILLAGLAIGWFEADNGLFLIVAGGLIAITGWVDDRGHVSAGVRLAVHFATAGVVVAALGPLSLSWLGGGHPVIEWPFSVIMLVWLINLFNFMDGIDGLASSEAICIYGGAGLLAALTLSEPERIAQPALLIAAAVAGFLVWNWQPAKIFMGDVCSGFLGLTVGILTLLAAREAAELGIAILILAGVFIVDATFTLLRRAQRRVKMYEAHRSHAYQILSRRLGAHSPVTLAIVAVNVLYLLPIAYLVSAALMAPIAGVALAYIPLFLTAFLLGAGKE